MKRKHYLCKFIEKTLLSETVAIEPVASLSLLINGINY